MPAPRISSIAWDSLLALAVVAGWAAYDLSLVVTSGEPYLVPRLLPGYLVAMLVAAAAGLLCSFDRRIAWTFLGIAAAAAMAPKFYRVDLGWHLICLPRAVFLLLAGFLAARSIAHRSRPAFWPGVGCGAIVAAVFAIYLGTVTAMSIIAIVAGALLLASSAIGRPRWRYATAAGAVLIPLSLVSAVAYRNANPPRPDQSFAAAVPGSTTKPNLILIVLDTVSAQHLAPYGYDRVTTPGLDAFAQAHMIRYTQARSVSSWTLPSHASMFTGLYPSEHGAEHPRSNHHKLEGPSARLELEPAEPLRRDAATLAERLTTAGYQTGAIVANCGYLSHQFGIDRGFEHYDDRPAVSSLLLLQLAGFRHDLAKGCSRRAETITDLAIRWIDRPERRQPFFLFLNFMDAHAPYVPPPPYDRLFAPERPRNPLKYERHLSALLYDRELRYLDTHVTRFLHALEARSLLTDTALVITADHGEGFGEHGFWEHDKALYEELIRVPLYVKPAGGSQRGVVEHPVTSSDLFHLMLTALGLATERREEAPMIAEWYQSDEATAAARLKRGEASVPLDRDLVTWLEAGRKWIVSSKGAVEAHDLGTDASERNPLTLSDAEVERARARARAWWEAHPPPPRDEGASPAMDPAILERLRNLGYVH